MNYEISPSTFILHNSSLILHPSVFCRQREIEGRTLARLTFGAHPAAVAPDDPFHRGQADTESPEFLGAGETLERDKELVHVRVIKTCPVVADKINRFPVDLRHAELDDRLLPHAGILPGVAEEVF